jgi:hypothetical protein
MGVKCVECGQYAMGALCVACSNAEKAQALEAIRLDAERYPDPVRERDFHPEPPDLPELFERLADRVEELRGKLEALSRSTTQDFNTGAQGRTKIHQHLSRIDQRLGRLEKLESPHRSLVVAGHHPLDLRWEAESLPDPEPPEKVFPAKWPDVSERDGAFSESLNRDGAEPPRDLFSLSKWRESGKELSQHCDRLVANATDARYSFHLMGKQAKDLLEALRAAQSAIDRASYELEGDREARKTLQRLHERLYSLVEGR